MRWVLGNWKMYPTPSQSERLAEQLRARLEPMLQHRQHVGVVVCPPFTSLEAVRRVLRGSPIGWGAQNCHEELEGAFTGEISARMLQELGCTLVLVGHSERRRYAAEDDARIARKLRQVVACGRRPVLCVGETLSERQSGHTERVLGEQLRRGLELLPEAGWERLLIAYEPVWAIGTGVAAVPEQIAEAHAFIHRFVQQCGHAATVSVLYGGSVTAQNVCDILAQPYVDGVLVGSASLEAEHFAAIVFRAVQEVWS